MLVVECKHGYMGVTGKKIFKFDYKFKIFHNNMLGRKINNVLLYPIRNSNIRYYNSLRNTINSIKKVQDL